VRLFIIGKSFGCTIAARFVVGTTTTNIPATADSHIGPATENLIAIANFWLSLASLMLQALPV
jgi:hypothetical protein